METEAQAVEFYRANGPYGEFSNLFRREVVVRGVSFKTSEHAYQSRKARRPEVGTWMLAAPTPSLVAAAAHALLHWDVAPGWSRFRYAWMMECVAAKFGQHEDLQRVLLGTGGRRLVEVGSVDNDVNRRWGEVNGRGRNFLGRILMRVRADLGGAPYVDVELDEKIAIGTELLAAA